MGVIGRYGEMNLISQLGIARPRPLDPPTNETLRLTRELRNLGHLQLLSSKTSGLINTFDVSSYNIEGDLFERNFVPCVARLYPRITPYLESTTPDECGSCFSHGKDECHDKRAGS